uniref:Uncharacterized protein n=2 Tax=Clytia hemisphaerica TaxID=252671 RepID=A0A7M5V9R7_9CNID
MPKFSLMSPGKSRKSSTRDEAQPLVQTNPNYTQNERTSSSSSYPERKTSTMSRSPSNNSDLSLDKVKIRPGMPHGPPSPRIPAVLDLNFDQTPFQFYTRNGCGWVEGVLQSTALVLFCLLCPSLFVFLIYCGANSVEKRQQKNKADEEKKKQDRFFMGLFFLTFLKDLMIIVLVIQSYFNTKASVYIVAYSPVVYCWILVLFVFPVTLFHFADVQYEFGFDTDRKKIMKTFAAYFFSSKTKHQQAQKWEAQDQYFSENYDLLSKIQTSNDELKYVYKSTKKSIFNAAIALSVIVALAHALVPCILQVHQYHTFTIQVLNETLANSTAFVNITTINGTTFSNMTNVTITEHVKHDVTMLAVVGLSTFNAFFVSLIAAPYFIYVILWKIGMLREWKRFNANERDTRKTLVNGGPQGIAMWWKIRQTLKLFSSGACLSSMISKMACVVAMVLVALLSATIVLNIISLDSDFNAHNLVPLMIDDLFLYAVILVLASLSVLIKKEQKVSGDTIELKQLNLCYELGHLMNLEQDAMDVEPGVKVKVRVFRGCLMLLQELSNTMENLEKGTASNNMSIFCFSVSTLLILPALGLGFRFLLAKW